jgi:hypothetical protein
VGAGPELTSSALLFLERRDIMAIDHWFSASYGEAWAKFLAAAQAAG